jgi:hypothetical protein
LQPARDRKLFPKNQEPVFISQSDRDFSAKIDKRLKTGFLITITGGA